MNKISSQEAIANAIHNLDNELSKRVIALDPKGYFIIKVDHCLQEIVLEYYVNDIDEKGRAINPKTKKPIGCNEKVTEKPKKIYRGKSAKQIGIQISEGLKPYPVSTIDHAIYLGRELQKAEESLKKNSTYIQD